MFKDLKVVLLGGRGDAHRSKFKYFYLHFGRKLGVDRVCLHTLTVFLPGFLSTLLGIHLTFVAIILPPCRDGVSRPYQDTAERGGKWWTPTGIIYKFSLNLNDLFAGAHSI